MLTVSDAPEDLMAAIRAGADGYLLKDMEPEQLLARVRDSLEGRTVISDTLTAALAGALRDEARGERRDVRDLTDRELAVLKCLAGGQSNKVIARNLSITEGTVKVHVKHLLKKLGFRSRVEAAVWASEQGLRVHPELDAPRLELAGSITLHLALSQRECFCVFPPVPSEFWQATCL